jgi:hypothetical protein
MVVGHRLVDREREAAMLGRKSYTREEIDSARATVDRRLAAHAALADAVAASADEKAQAALESFDASFFNDMINHDGVLRGINVIAYVPEESVTQLRIGDRIQLSRQDFQRLADGVLAELEEKFLTS